MLGIYDHKLLLVFKQYKFLDLALDSVSVITFLNVIFLQAYNFQSDFNKIIRLFLFFYFATFLNNYFALNGVFKFNFKPIPGVINEGIVDYKVSVKHFELSTFKS